MAYSDYQTAPQRWKPPARTTQPTAQMYDAPQQSPLGDVGAAPTAQQPQQSAAGPVPVTTRQDALQQVQQAYAGRMPGNGLPQVIENPPSLWDVPVSLTREGMPPMGTAPSQGYTGRMPGQMDALNSAITNFQQPVGLNDPGLAPALRAGAGADQRSFERQRAALAEALGANGLGDSGAFNTQLQNIGQRVGEAGAQRDAGLVYDEMGSRRNALLSALGMDQQRYNVDNDLGLRLAQLEAMLNGQAMQPFV